MRNSTKYFFVLFLIVSLFSTKSFAHNEAFSGVQMAMAKGEVGYMSKYFDKMIDITMNNEVFTYSRSQAVLVIDNFFKNNPVDNYSVLHIGESNDKVTMYIIGMLETKNHNFRIYVLMKNKGKDYWIQDIRFE